MKVDTLRPELREKICEWIISFYHLDPRYKILTFFNLVASEGADKLANDEDGDFVDDYDLDRTTSHLSTSHHHNLHVHEKQQSSPTFANTTTSDFTHNRTHSADFVSSFGTKPTPINQRSKTAQPTVLRPSATHLGLRESTIEMMSKFFDASSILTVWRPCSNDAMRKMMEGTGVGKGLDIKGKSAKKGVLSAFVPFMQIHDNAHKTLIQQIPTGSEMRIYYTTAEARQQVMDHLQKYIDRYQTSSEGVGPNTSSSALIQWQSSDCKMKAINKFSNKQWYGLQLSQRLFWFATVQPKDVNIDRSTHHDGCTTTGRPSTPGFQDANNRTLRTATAQIPKPNPMPVVIQYNGIIDRDQTQKREKQNDGDGDDKDPLREYSPLDPLYLVMAYEEAGTVTPVVSDFDGFLLGWRREALWFGCNLPRDQEKLMMWCIEQIEHILESPPSTDTWTCRWLDVLKEENAARSAHGGFHPDIPEYGFGDPKSYTIMEQAALRLKTTGAVRHGSECFNYYFPQEIDDVFLLISDTLRPVPWRYVNVNELQSILSQKIAEGFVFPLNPKWILCDPGWYDLYQKLMASDALYADLSKDVWYPPFSGVREKIDAIKKKFPDGFQRQAGRVSKRGSISVARGISSGDKAAADARRAREELLEELQASTSTILTDDYSPLRDNLHNEGFGEDGREESHLSGNAAADLAEIELENYVSVKHTLARQIYEANLEDMNEEDEWTEEMSEKADDGESDSQQHRSKGGGGSGTSSRRSMASETSGRSLGSTGSATSSASGRASLNDFGSAHGVSRRTMFKMQRDSQLANEGRYRTAEDVEEGAVAKSTTSGTSATSAATTTTNTTATTAATTKSTTAKNPPASTSKSNDKLPTPGSVIKAARHAFANHLAFKNQPRRNFSDDYPPSTEFTGSRKKGDKDVKK